jgi:7,8-dihydro-6-hydroxymethylpterin-pyrophosphokinase
MIDKYAPRTIDLDLLPAPLSAGHRQQAFIMVPLAEIEPSGIDPETGKTYEEIARPLPEGTYLRLEWPDNG